MKHTIDAQDKTIGRVATQAATLLLGKNDPSFERNRIAGNHVTITNAAKVKIHPKKLTQKEYVRFSGYPSGLKTATLQKVIDTKGYQEVFRKAVYGMLPANRLRKELMKQLTVEE